MLKYCRTIGAILGSAVSIAGLIGLLTSCATGSGNVPESATGGTGKGIKPATQTEPPSGNAVEVIDIDLESGAETAEYAGQAGVNACCGVIADEDKFDVCVKQYRATGLCETAQPKVHHPVCLYGMPVNDIAFE